MSEVEQQPEAGEKTAAAEGYLYALDKQEAIALRQWWRRLVMDQSELKRYSKQRPYPRGVRAALRRCDSIESVMLTEAFRHLWQALESRAWEETPPKAFRDHRLTTWAAVAAVSSELRAETFDASLGKRLGEKRPNTVDTPRMSDLRFQQLLDCHTPEELIRRFRRALKLAENTGVSVVRLADMVALWEREQRGQYRTNATQRFAFVMSDAYFQARALKTAAGD
ncbi:type I-E CRISPR-associated protein Cse2/CasB [Halomonas janggokensis]|uniref:Type I-E CRISPR-associated protein Cse2/CasB n=1 Tax=Vreelandella janggokensis TaxID=370767 RepID=A0ABT4IUP4_9GAMM|nr:type I-E CRISPR-associated protein Cse2/CasB [Halomonas janggokensis]MCZ0927170.1 type I-E CRISPR-associated protein Cse2/CasB [Halomonas janggokensis]MCZ0929678.1 type I-E CRISPR-associated protein Cse2/CasB [Halomonas janggokensis]